MDSFESGPHFCKESLLQNLLSYGLCFAFHKSYYYVFFLRIFEAQQNQEAEVTENLKNGIVQYQN